MNSVRSLSKNGIILIDDAWPDSELSAKRYSDLSPEEKFEISRNAFSWRGDVYIFLIYVSQNLAFSNLLTVEMIVDSSQSQAILTINESPTKLFSLMKSLMLDFAKFEMSVREERLWKSQDK